MTIVATWPLPTMMADHLPGSPKVGRDVLLVVWIQAWVARAITQHPTKVFEANIHHPTPNILAYSEHLLGTQATFAPTFLATGNPVLAHNVTVLATYVLGAVFMFLLIRCWTRSYIAGLVAGLCFVLAPWRFNWSHLPQLLSIQYLPLLLLVLDRVQRDRRYGVAVCAGIVLGLQTLCSYYLGYMAFTLVGLAIVADTIVHGARGRRPQLLGQALVVLVALVVVLPVTLPYVRAQSGGAFDLPESWKSMLEDQGGLPALIERTGWLVGFAPCLLGLLGFIPIVRATPRDRSRRLVLALTAVAGFLVAAGPAGVAGGWIAPYGWLCAIVPGFDSFRDPTRFLILMSFGVSGLVGYAVAELERRLTAAHITSAWTTVGIGTIAALLVPLSTKGIPTPSRVTTPATVPAAHRWLAANGNGGPLLELGTSEVQATFDSIYHWLPLLNGYTGYWSTIARFTREQVEQLPSRKTLDLLVACTGLRWVLIHDETSRTSLRPWARDPDVRYVRAFRHRGEDATHYDILYEIPGVQPPSRCTDALAGAPVTARGNPIRPLERLDGRVEVLRVTSRVRPKERRIRILLENTGTMPWPATAIARDHRVELLVSWTKVGAAKSHVQRIPLPDDVPAGGRRVFWLWTRGPRRIGVYDLEVTVYQANRGTALRTQSRFAVHKWVRRMRTRTPIRSRSRPGYPTESAARRRVSAPRRAPQTSSPRTTAAHNESRVYGLRLAQGRE